MTISQKDLEEKVLGMIAPALDTYKVTVRDQRRNNQLIEKERKKLSEKLRRMVDLYTDGMIDRADYDRRRKEIDEKLETLDPAPELPNITTDFSGMYSKLSPERKNVFWKAFLDHVSVSKNKEVNIAFHTAKVLAERMGMIEMQ